MGYSWLLRCYHTGMVLEQYPRLPFLYFAYSQGIIIRAALPTNILEMWGGGDIASEIVMIMSPMYTLFLKEYA